MHRHNLVVLIQCLLATAFLIQITTAIPVGLVGGISEANPNEPIYLTLAEESLNKYLKDSNAKRHNKVIEIKKASTQVVAGSLKRIEFTASPTNCELSDGSLKPGSSNCEVVNPSDTITCNSKIWEKPWENFKEITVSCKV